MKITCIIVEDEPVALNLTTSYVEKLHHLELLSTFDNALDALAFLKENTVDLIFLDINMEEFTGIQLLENSTIDGDVIITTASSEHALKGYELNVTDYLLKPFTFERFLQAVDKVKPKSAQTETEETSDFLFIKTENRLEKILINDILYVEGKGDYRRIHTHDKRIMTLQTFSELEEAIPSNNICRVHRSYMVALDKIDSVVRSRIRISNVIIPISETYKKSFFKLINHSE